MMLLLVLAEFPISFLSGYYMSHHPLSLCSFRANYGSHLYPVLGVDVGGSKGYYYGCLWALYVGGERRGM